MSSFLELSSLPAKDDAGVSLSPDPSPSYTTSWDSTSYPPCRRSPASAPACAPRPCLPGPASKSGIRVEVSGDGLLSRRHDEDDVIYPRGGGLFHGEVDGRTVQHGDHHLGYGPGGRQEPGAQPGHRHDGLAYAQHDLRSSSASHELCRKFVTSCIAENVASSGDSLHKNVLDPVRTALAKKQSLLHHDPEVALKGAALDSRAEMLAASRNPWARSISVSAATIALVMEKRGSNLMLPRPLPYTDTTVSVSPAARALM